MDNGLFDIHCHILPAFDEGPSHRGETLRMLQIAKKDGISGIVATPHIMNGVYDHSREAIEKAVAEANNLTDNLPIYSGAEVRISKDLLQRAAGNDLPLINGKSFLLVELPTYLIPPVSELEIMVRNLGAMNITPIFTHPERNLAILHDVSVMGRLIQCGALFQITAMSITKQLGGSIERAALKMIKKGYVHVVASDAHDAEKRPPILSEAFLKISRRFGEDEARRLFVNNPFRIIHGERVE